MNRHEKEKLCEDIYKLLKGISLQDKVSILSSSTTGFICSEVYRGNMTEIEALCNVSIHYETTKKSISYAATLVGKKLEPQFEVNQ